MNKKEVIGIYYFPNINKRSLLIYLSNLKFL